MNANLPEINIGDADTFKRSARKDVENYVYFAMVSAAVNAVMSLSNLCTILGKTETAAMLDETVARPLAALLVDIYKEKNAANADASGQN